MEDKRLIKLPLGMLRLEIDKPLLNKKVNAQLKRSSSFSLYLEREQLQTVHRSNQISNSYLTCGLWDKMNWFLYEMILLVESYSDKSNTLTSFSSIN